MDLCGFRVGLDRPLFLIAGAGVIESEQLALDTAGALKDICAERGVPFVYKSSFDKANRSSHRSYRGPGLEKGLAVLERVRREVDVPVLTDVDEDTPLAEVARVVSVLQTPAFLVVGVEDVSRLPFQLSIFELEALCQVEPNGELWDREAHPCSQAETHVLDTQLSDLIPLLIGRGGIEELIEPYHLLCKRHTKLDPVVP